MKATGTGQIPVLSTILMRLMKIDALNHMISEAGELKGMDFARFIFKFLKINIEVDSEQVKNIPSTGAFIALANHPYGAVESLALLNLLVTHRPDTLFMGNFLLKKIPHLADHIIAVNPFENIRDCSSISGLKTTLNTLREGKPVAIFPAGEVSAFDIKALKITDKEWHPVVGKLIARAQVPVLPIYFHGRNSIAFSLLRYVHPSLQTAMLPVELFNKEDRTIKISIGKLLGTATNPLVYQDPQLLAGLRKQTYLLEL
jgi:putative hemolysin